MSIKKGGVNKAEQAKWVASAQKWWAEHKEEQLNKLKGVHTETWPKKRHSVPPKDTVELSQEATNVFRRGTKEVGKGDAVATKGSDGTWTTSYNGENYTSKGDGTIQNSKGETTGTYDNKGNIYDKNGKKVGTGKASSDGNAAIIDLDGDKENKYTLFEAKDNKEGGSAAGALTIKPPYDAGKQSGDDPA